MTEAPTLTLVVDLGETPTLPEVSEYLSALAEICYFSLVVGEVSSPEGRSLPLSDAPEALDGLLRVARINMASPMEVMLTTVATGATPIGAVVAAFFVLERSLDMIIKWQRHRAELPQLRASGEKSATALPPEPEALRDVAIMVVSEVSPLEALDQISVPETLAAQEGFQVIAQRRVLRVEVTAGNRGESAD